MCIQLLNLLFQKTFFIRHFVNNILKCLVHLFEIANLNIGIVDFVLEGYFLSSQSFDLRCQFLGGCERDVFSNLNSSI